MRVYNTQDDGGKRNIVASIGTIKRGLLILRCAQDDKDYFWSSKGEKVALT